MDKDKREQLDALVKRAQDGDTQAFGNIYDELVKPVYRYIFYRVAENIAEDLTEETFLKVWQNLKKYKKTKHPFSSWVFRIAHNLVVDYYRKNHVTNEISEELPDTQESNNPEHKVNIKLTQIRLKKVIRHLPDNYKEVIILKYVNDFNNKEISDTIGKSEATVRTIQFRALKKLRAMLSEEEEVF